MATSNHFVTVLEETQDNDSDIPRTSFLHELDKLVTMGSNSELFTEAEGVDLPTTSINNDLHVAMTSDDDDYEEESSESSDFDNIHVDRDDDHCMYKMTKCTIDKAVVIAASIILLVIQKNMSVAAYNCLMGVLLVTGIVQKRHSWKSLVKLVQRVLYSTTAPFEIRTFESHKSVIFDMRFQVELMLTRYLDVIKSYKESLKEDCGDVLCGNLNEPEDQLIINLHLSTDGGQLYRYKKNNLWPLHAIILDLPFDIRCRPENIMILALWCGRDKPNWTALLQSYLQQSVINEKITVLVNNFTVNVTLTIHSAVFDLPAMANVLNHFQYNGKFGCLYCCAPGFTMKVGKGHSRKFGFICDPLSDNTYEEYASVAESSKEPIFGIKGRSCLAGFVDIPSHILIDSLHLLFENCGKSILTKLFASPSYREEYFLGRHIDHCFSEMQSLRCPNFIPCPRRIGDLPLWKGRDHMNFIFYFSIPSVYKSLLCKPFSHDEYAFHFMSFVIACKLCYLRNARSKYQIINELFTYFWSRLNCLYDDSMLTINMHLLLHLGEQIRKFGSLAFCSMFPFERQFYNFKVYSQGTSSFLHQIANKITLMKHCTTYLDVCDYDKKVQILSYVSADDDSKFKFVNRGVLSKGRVKYFSESYVKGDVSTFYQIDNNSTCLFGSVIEFFVKRNEIFAKVIVYEDCSSSFFKFESMSLPDVPAHIVNIVKDEMPFYSVRNARKIDTFSLSALVHPCVVYFCNYSSVDEIILMPCASVHEYC